MDRMFEIVLLALIFGGFDHRFVAEGIHCPEFRMSEDLTVFSFDDRPTTGICVSEVSTRHVLKQTFHVIDNFERACNYYYHGHLRWNRNRFVDGYKHRRRHSVPWFNQGYAIRKWDLDGPEEVATGLSEGILRVDRLYRRKNLLENESSLVYEDIITSVPRGGDFKVQLCSLIVNDTVEGNFEFYGNGSDNILWEPCTQRRSDYFYCLLQPIDSRHHKSTKPLICNEGYTGFYCILENRSCEVQGCSNSGKCFLGVEGDRCHCFAGYNGKNCAEIMNPCTDVNCNNRGNCTVKNGHPVCVCNDENYTGAFCERRRPGLVGPLINGPLQDVFATMLTHQGTPCENFEMNYMRCMEAYGQILGKRYCDLELRDFYECVYKTKRENRFMTIRHERSRQVIIMNTEKASNKEGAFNKDLKKSNQPNKEDDPYSWFEDDEFEEFSDGDCSDGELPENSEENTEDLWEDNWDDDNVEEDFSVRLHRERAKNEREKSADQVEADEAQNCGVGKEAGQKVRKAWAGQKQFDASFERAFAVAVGRRWNWNGKVRHYRGIRDGAISNYSDYWIFAKNGKNAFDAYPVGEIYNLIPVRDRKAMSIEEVEEHFKRRREIVLNQFALKARIRRPGEENDDESESPLWKANNKDQQSEATKMKSMRKVHKTKTDKRNDHEDGVVMEESDDGDEDGREVDYISSGVVLEEKTLVGIDEELVDAFQSVDESEQDDENAENDKQGGPIKLDMNKKTFPTTANFGMRAERDFLCKFVVQEQESSSGSEDFDSEDIKSPFLLQCKTDVKPVSSKRKVELDSLAVQKPEKKAKLPNAGTDSDGSNDWFRIMEEEVRHCFQRHPMSTTDLVAKFKSRCKKMNKQEIVSQLANILKKLKPEQTRRKGTALHFTLLYVARIFHKFAAVSMNR
ncbi:Sushi, nidogen and EGF-like domain-containing protein 1 [Trichinella nelsoni]|uniref:26S proteasome complex subunit dss-1 n=1 Tax=Trichinella nelsoni TaxID=6336 RepID=A0A0V0S3P3_9BILA|nr:Sushi, nidogen and EGF-like domain-containing protein 1 [Trichinella nelsoni]